MFHCKPAAQRLTGLLALAFLMAVLASAQTQDPKVLGFKKQFVIEISNPGPVALDNHPVIIDVAAVRGFASDFNTYNYAVFDEAGGDYRLVVTQADDLDGDRYHDEIVFIRSLPPSSTTRLTCYYSPTRSFQLLPTAKAGARTGWEPGSATAGWESNLGAYKFVNGRIEFYGKLYDGLILRKLPADERRLQEWGMNVLDAGESPGLGGLSLWDGDSRIPFYGPAEPPAKLTVVSSGPIRALVRADLTGGGQPEEGPSSPSTFRPSPTTRGPGTMSSSSRKTADRSPTAPASRSSPPRPGPSRKLKASWPAGDGHRAPERSAWP